MSAECTYEGSMKIG